MTPNSMFLIPYDQHKQDKGRMNLTGEYHNSHLFQDPKKLYTKTPQMLVK